MCDSNGVENKIYPPANPGFHLITSIISSFKVFLQRPTEVEIARHNNQAEEWMGRTFAAACRGGDDDDDDDDDSTFSFFNSWATG
jgi:hypothetical protein